MKLRLCLIKRYLKDIGWYIYAIYHVIRIFIEVAVNTLWYGITKKPLRTRNADSPVVCFPCGKPMRVVRVSKDKTNPEYTYTYYMCDECMWTSRVREKITTKE